MAAVAAPLPPKPAPPVVTLPAIGSAPKPAPAPVVVAPAPIVLPAIGSAPKPAPAPVAVVAPKPVMPALPPPLPTLAEAVNVNTGKAVSTSNEITKVDIRAAQIAAATPAPVTVQKKWYADQSVIMKIVLIGAVVYFLYKKFVA